MYKIVPMAAHFVYLSSKITVFKLSILYVFQAASLSEVHSIENIHEEPAKDKIDDKVIQCMTPGSQQMQA